MDAMPLEPLVMSGPLVPSRFDDGDAEDLSEAEGDDGEVVAAEPEGDADEDAEDEGGDGSDEDGGPEGQLDAEGEVGAPETRAAA